MYTQQQQHQLHKNPHRKVLDKLIDGDLLIVFTINRPIENLDHPHPESIPYILTKDGKVQGIGYHYRYYHLADIPAYGAEDAPPSLTGPQLIRNHN